jgi:tripartite-type tricarboxylate transporter receptor subunit TctC
LILLLLATPAAAQQFPSKPINMVVVFAPGGATDVLARIAADHMSRTLGQRVIVENVTGAGGTVGGARGAQAAPDGYTLTVGSMGSHSAAPTIYASSIKYNPLELEPIGVIGGTPLYFMVRNDFPAKTFEEFAAQVKANPGKISNAHAGVGSTNHLAYLLLTHLTGLSFNSVAYRGEGPAMSDLVAGHIDSGAFFAPAAVPQLQAGKVRALMIAHSCYSHVQGGRRGAVPAAGMGRCFRAQGHAEAGRRQAVGGAAGGGRRSGGARAHRGARRGPGNG